MDDEASASRPPLALSLDLVSSFKPAQVFKDFVQPDCRVTSLDYDDRGEPAWRHERATWSERWRRYGKSGSQKATWACLLYTSDAADDTINV